MRKTISYIILLFLMSCGAAKIEQDVTLVQRPVYENRLTTDRPVTVKDAPKEESLMIIEEAQIVEEKDVGEESETLFEARAPEAEVSEPEIENTIEDKMETAGASKEMGPLLPDAITGNNVSNAANIEKIMTFLTADELQGRDSGSEGIEKAAEYIEKVFKANGIVPYFKDYRDEIPEFEGAFNVVGYLKGNDAKLRKEFIIIGAHYDHIGNIEPKDGDAIANGANDNASGTATVLELARYFGNTKSNKRSIIFALFSAEEKGLKGSKHLAKKLKAENLDLYTMLNYEMTGVPMVDKDYLMYATGYKESTLAGVCNMYAGQNLIGYLPKAKAMNLFQRSDNYPFYVEFNVPCQTFSTFDFTNFDEYHQVGDELELMDFDHMATIVNKSIPIIENIVNSSTKMIKLN